MVKLVLILISKVEYCLSIPILEAYSVAVTVLRQYNAVPIKKMYHSIKDY